VGWLACFLTSHLFRRATPRGVLVMSVLGNIVVSLAWFGGNLLSEVHRHGTADYSWLLAPAGWWRLRNAGH
jgi:hypothetical protein